MAPESLQIESPEKKVATKSYEDILKDVGASGVDALQEVVDDLNPKWEGTKYFHKVLEELREAERKEAEALAILHELGVVSFEEVEEIWQALQKELSKPDEGPEIAPETIAQWFEEKSYFSKVWEQIKKLLSKKLK